MLIILFILELVISFFSCVCSFRILLSHCVVADTLSLLAVQIFFLSPLKSLGDKTIELVV